MKSIIKNTLILTLITVIAGAALGMVYEITKAPIAAANEKAKQEACQQVFPEADEFELVEVDAEGAANVIAELAVNASVDEVYIAKMSGSEVGYVVTTTDGDGYGGNIQLSVGIMKNGAVNGVSILAISETAGLGMNAAEPSFLSQYAGKSAGVFYVTKDGGNGDPIDSITGATITTRAVTDGVNAALAYHKLVLGGSANE